MKRIPRWEIEYVSFVSEEEGMSYIFTRPYDLIFLDYYLATTVAPDIITSVREGGCETPIIVLSAKNFDSNMIDKINKAGGNQTYLKKKFDEKTIELLIHHYLDVTLFLPLEIEKTKELSQLSVLYEDGRLIQNYIALNGKFIRETEGEPRQHLFASSLIAVNQFLQKTAESRSPFQEIQSKDMTLMIERGNRIAISVISKTSNPYIRYHIHKMIIEIENEYANILESWNGDLSGINIDLFLEELHVYAK
ncbi:MAG: response regulator [Candidatus Heimdallarchaeota archaeon]|nr:response regulator [Candidatus Heimdallarchaeota archaeon]